jgi:undecaprenyl diphosphate synthase
MFLGENMEELKIPNHVGIIMDGNRRWAKERGKKSIDGHLAGANNIMELAKHVFATGVKYLSIYAFSTENFNRSEEEVGYLMGLIIKFFNERAKELDEYNIKIVLSGKRERLKDDVWQCICKVMEMTKNNSGGVLNVCLNYGGRAEIIDAVKKIKDSDLEINEENFAKCLYQDLPDLDFVIRTSGEMRISNFMLWQISYAELYFPKIYFPDFNNDEFDKALEEYNNRHRRFGGN